VEDKDQRIWPIDLPRLSGSEEFTGAPRHSCRLLVLGLQ
jgi:hypothetical protein